MNHYFDLYTVRVRKKREKSNSVLDNYDNAGTNLIDTLHTSLKDVEDFIDDSENKIVSLKADCHIDKSSTSIYGYIKTGPYGTPLEIVNRKNPEKRTNLTEDDANVFTFFYYFYIPNKKTTGALIVHKISNHGMFTRLKKIVNSSFNFFSEEFVLEIDPVYFNLKKNKDVIFHKLEYTLSFKKTHSEKATTGSLSPKIKNVGKFVLNMGAIPSLAAQLQKAEDGQEFALSAVHPFLQNKALNSYHTSVSAKVKIGGQNRTIKLSKKLEYNTDVDVTKELTMKGGKPTLESLVKCAKDNIKMLKENGTL